MIDLYLPLYNRDSISIQTRNIQKNTKDEFYQWRDYRQK